MSSKQDSEAFFKQLQQQVRRDDHAQVTPRQFLRAMGAKRRGSQIVAEIESRLAKWELKVEPSLVEVGADDPVVVLSASEHPPYFNVLTQADRRLDDPSAEPLQVTPREMLQWFGAQRRGAQIRERIRATLDGFNLATHPDFESVWADEPIALIRKARRGSPPESGTGAVSEAVHQETHAESGTEQGPPAASTPFDTPSEITNAPSTDTPSEISVPVRAAHAATFHVGTLREVNRPVESISPQSSLRAAMTKMTTCRVGRLAIMPRNGRIVNGLLRWKDIGHYLSAKNDASVDDPVECAMIAKPPVVDHDRPFLEVTNDILRHGSVFVRGPRGTIGILTQNDMGKRLREFAEPFVLIQEIERCIKFLIDGEFTTEELQSVAYGGSKADVRSVDDLTLGNCQQLLAKPEYWQRLNIPLDRGTFVQKLGDVRGIRNRVMHFDPEDLNDEDMICLQRFLDLVYQLRSYADE